jgi:translation initiation factor IF-2
MTDSAGLRLKRAGPSQAVELSGFRAMPKGAPDSGQSLTATAGDDFFFVESETQAREVCERRLKVGSNKGLISHLQAKAAPAAKEAQALEGPAARELRLVVKADSVGSVEAVFASLVGGGESP